MKTVKNIASKVVRHKTSRQTAVPVCNYADNYYGDRVCVMPAKVAR
ncbi:MAG: hypothetical protein KYX62_17365 [Pseudomonadota bacterium]|nr:hypothetical protein [Pseudomonadota bacterium]